MACTPSLLITSSKDKNIRLHDVATGKTVSSFSLNQPSDVALHPNGLCLAVSNQSKIQLYDIRVIDKGNVCSVNVNLPCPVKPVFGPQGTCLLISGTKYLRTLSLKDLDLIHRYDREELTFTGGFSITPDEQFILAATNQNKILALETNLNGKAQERAVFSCNSEVTGIACSTKYANFVTVGPECTFWSVDTHILNSLTSFDEH